MRFASIIFAAAFFAVCGFVSAANDPAANVIVGSNWQGTQDSYEHAHGRTFNAHLAISDEENGTLKGKFTLRGGKKQNGPSVVKVAIRVDHNKGLLEIRPYEIISGDWGDGDVSKEVWNGTVSDSVISLIRHRKNGDLKIQLSLQSDK